MIKNLLEEIDRAHHVFSDIFPHPGLVASGGTRIVASSGILLVLHLRAGAVQKVLRRWRLSLKGKAILKELWREARLLLLQLGKQGQDGDPAICDQIGRYLYLISGVSWWLASQNVAESDRVEPMSVIEPISGILAEAGVSQDTIENIETLPGKIAAWRESITSHDPGPGWFSWILRRSTSQRPPR